MPKGGILIGWGFTPTDEDVKVATAAGYLKNADAVTLTSMPKSIEMTDDHAKASYTRQLRTQGWDFPGDIQVSQLTTRDGRKMWSVCPTSAAPAQNPLDMTAMEDVVGAALKRTLQEAREKGEIPQKQGEDMVSKALRETLQKRNEREKVSHKKWWQFWKK